MEYGPTRIQIKIAARNEAASDDRVADTAAELVVSPLIESPS